MPKFAANLSMLYNEVPFMERFDKAGAAGFKAVEFLYPYAFSAADIKAKLDSNGLALVLHNIPAGDWDGGERGIACLPDRVDEYRAGVAKAIEYAKALGVPQLNCLAGKAPAGADRKALHDTFVANLKYTAAEQDAVIKYAVGAASFAGAPFINHQTLSEKGFIAEGFCAFQVAVIQYQPKKGNSQKFKMVFL